jgi:hypothetical protein
VPGWRRVDRQSHEIAKTGHVVTLAHLAAKAHLGLRPLEQTLFVS